MTTEATHSSTTTEHRSDYWDEYYAARATTRRPLPSQFATFVAGELERPHRVIELGCGNGRDSIFFASYGHQVTGVDGSEAAVHACSALAGALGESATFLQSAIDDPALADRLSGSEGPHLALRALLRPRDHRRGGAALPRPRRRADLPRRRARRRVPDRP